MTETSHHHVPPGLLRAYREGRIEATKTLAVSDALAACSECRTALAALPPGPAYEAIADAADRGLDPAAFADDPITRAELADLLAFRHEMNGHSDKVFGPAPVQGQREFPGKVVPLPKAFWMRKSIMALTAAAALVLLAGGWWMFASSNDGGEGRLLSDGQGHRIALAALPADLREAVQGALRDGRLPTDPALAKLRPAAGTLAGTTDNAAGFHLVAPVGTVVRDVQPLLRWTARQGAERHKVIVVDTENGNETSVDFIGPVTRWTAWRLTPGRSYEWQVEAMAGGEVIDRAPKPPAPEARFRVLGEAERAELDRIEAQYGQYPLVLAVAYAHAGLTGEEAAALDRLAREHPQSALARRLRAEASGQHPPE